ncbi:AraC family transcriptional regulator [Paenibacillus sp. TRM 82003]|nr:AraC family transcriptional regulator [Paenibacillus sp. TRM 82003]
MRKPFQSVWSRMVFSYLAVVLVIALLLSSVFYLYFSHQYREEIHINKQMMLRNTVNHIESTVIHRVNQIYLSLALRSSVGIDLGTLQGNHSKIMDIQELLTHQVSNHSDIVQAIHIYDVEQRHMISSVHGLLLYKDGRSDAGAPADWIEAMRKTEGSSLWMDTRMVPQDAFTELSEQGRKNPIITYVHSYPFQSSGQDCKLMIAIDVKEAAVSRIIGDMLPADFERTFIVNGDGAVISAADKSLLGNPVEEDSLRRSLLSLDSSAGSFTHTFDQGAYVVSYNPLEAAGWKMYMTTPVKTFYYKMDGLREGVLSLCLLAVVVGVVLSSVFTAAGYSPLRRIMNTIKSKLDSPVGAKLNEYRLIDTTINSLSNKVDSLEEILQANHKVIRHNIILNMLNNRFTPEELSEQLSSIQVETDGSRFRCIVIDPVSEKWKELPPRQLQHTLYSMIHQIETADFPETRLLAEELQDHKMVVVVCTNEPDDQLSERIADYILSEVKARFGLEFVLSLGSWVPSWNEVYMSYREAKTLIKYSYFFPGLSVIQDLDLLRRETSDAEIPDSYLANFEKKLQARDLKNVVQAIEDLTTTIKEGMYSAEYSRIMLLKMVSLFSDCIGQVRWQPAETSSMNLYKQYTAINNIDRFSAWIIQLSTEFIQQMERRSEERSIDAVTAVKAYVREHLSGDLSLDHAAEQAFISPKYLSKIFKEETGVSYTEYVTNQRMERARELMTTRDLTVEQVASTVGYRTPAYFIKKFKEIHGCTPKNFMRRAMN